MFLQRHICNAMQENFQFMNEHWGVPDQAKEFAQQCDSLFYNLRLYPFVRRYNCTDSASYHKSIDDGFVVTVKSPHLVSPQIWNWLCYKGPHQEYYHPNPNPHVNEWHKHNPPPGTAYHPHPRMDHPSLTRRSDTVQQLEKLHQIAPYDTRICAELEALKYKGQATASQVEELYRPVLEFDPSLIARLAQQAEDTPSEYEKLMVKASALDPDWFEARFHRGAAYFLLLGKSHRGLRRFGVRSLAGTLAGQILPSAWATGKSRKAGRLGGGGLLGRRTSGQSSVL